MNHEEQFALIASLFTDYTERIANRLIEHNARVLTLIADPAFKQDTPEANAQFEAAISENVAQLKNQCEEELKEYRAMLKLVSIDDPELDLYRL